ncbi:MAG: tRNA pseudouridine(38-40) synthase TruA [Chlamydiia bacterium]|nr:tRNA pseudouridine(38-40) synthase TruA [Chlamydiia bacterium]
MQNYRFDIAYDGKDFSGWQIQPNAPSIQETIEKALRLLCKQPIRLMGSGRTDAGVHALGQVAHAKCPLPPSLKSLNGILPPTIRILSVTEVPFDFHSQYSAKSKEYHYHLCLEPVLSPFKRGFCWHIQQPIDLHLLEKGTEAFIGTHDFTTFSNQANQGSAARNPVRTIKRITLVEEEGGIRLEFEANGFLYKMVRNITGTLVSVASGKLPLMALPHLLAARDRRKACPAAPPFGLFLFSVYY